MKKILNKLNNAFKAIIKKLNNYRLTALIISCVNLVAGIVSLGLLFIYYFAGVVSKVTLSQQPSFVGLKGADNFPYGRILGMVFFLFMIFNIILSIAIIYNLLPAIRNKEKVTPKRSPLIMAIVNGSFGVVVLVFSILAIVLEKPNTYSWYIVTIPFTVLTSIANILCIVPFLKCVFYQPSVGLKLNAPKEEVK